jgi:hypothetical protein
MHRGAAHQADAVDERAQIARRAREDVFSHADSLSANGSSLLSRFGVWNAGSTVPARRYLRIVLRDRPVRRAISRIES